MPVTITEGSVYLGKKIRDSGIRESGRGLVIGIERRGQRILNPDSSLLLEKGDLGWLVGDVVKIRSHSF
ncbi:MAG: TrkA C-terminal domain-containing protein [Bdellovibrionales bacterium]|nr:TrkA C-terminal domain-containing protein [Bdellovibrionales bacterium]